MRSIFTTMLFFQTFFGLAQNVGIGTQTPLQKLHVVGNAVVSGNLGIGIANPQAPIHLRNDLDNKRIVLYDAFGNDHQFFGFGINTGMLRYQSDVDHVFFSGESASSSLELLRLNANGNVGIGNSNPQSRLSVTGNAEVSGNTSIGGNLSVGLTSAAYRLDVGGSGRFNGDLLLNSSSVGGTWFFISNFYGSPTGWKMVATPDGKLNFFNTSNSSALTILQNGNAAVSGNFSIGGELDFGYQTIAFEIPISSDGIAPIQKACPAGTKMISGGGGYSGYDPDIAKNIETFYNGPDPDWPDTKWRLYVWNKNDASVTFKVVCICAKIK